jgi:large subunit ribosomal protein L21e
MDFNMKRIGSFRRKTRSKLRKNVKDSGRINIGDYLREYKEGDIVVLKAEPAVQKGIYFPRFHGRHGVIIGKKGKCYEVKIKDINKEKMVIVHPVHLRAA